MTNWLKSLLSLSFLAVMLAFGYQQTQAPAKRVGTGLDFAAINRHIAVIAAKPHPMGSAENREVRDYIVRHFKSLGLSTEVQKTTVVYRHPFKQVSRTIIGNVENIIARLPGKSAAAQGVKDLVLMGHYDSRPDGPGAGDDAAGTASIMEVARIMSAGPAPVHDVVFLITDGEEMGLLGAQGYFRQHPEARDTGLVLNFEARGSYGASSMFETSADNAWLIEQLLESAPDLLASSLSYEIYKRMPNDTDMSISKGEGIPGLNFGFVSGLFDYHAMTDSPENLDKDTLAHQANYILATARHFAGLKQWQTATGDKTYFNLWQGRLVSYGQGTAIVIAVLVLGFGLWLLVSGLRTGNPGWRSITSGVVAVFTLVILVSNVFESMIGYQQTADAGIARLISLGEWPLLPYFLTTLGITIWFARAVKDGFGKAAVFAPALIIALLSVLSGRPWIDAVVTFALLVALLMFIRNRKNTPDLWGATLVLWALLSAMLVYAAPNASYLLIWPLASVLLSYAVQRHFAVATGSSGRFYIGLVASFIPLLLLTPVIVLAYLALGSTLPQAFMVICALSLLLIWPLLRNITFAAGNKSGPVLLGTGLLMMGFVVFGRNFDTRHPRAEELFYAIDVEGQRGLWVSSDVREGSWLDNFIGKNSSKFNMNQIIPGYDQITLIRETPMPDYEPATLEITRNRVADGAREIHMHLQSPAAAEYINLLFPVSAHISSAKVNGFPVPVPTQKREPGAMYKAYAMKEADEVLEENWWRWRWYGLPSEGAEIVLTADAAHPLPIMIIEVDYGTPDDAPARPPQSMPRPYTWSDSTVIYQTVVLE